MKILTIAVVFVCLSVAVGQVCPSGKRIAPCRGCQKRCYLGTFHNTCTWFGYWCTFRCVCPPNTASYGSRCVTRSQCRNIYGICDSTETRRLRCERSCSYPYALSCTIRDCRCKKGLCRDSNNRCVPHKPTTTTTTTTTTMQATTQPECGLNEEFHPPGSCLRSGCPSNCALLNQPPPIICPAVCLEGCLCKPGYCRNSTGVCVENPTTTTTTTTTTTMQTTTNPECGLNEEFHPPGSCLSGCHSNCALLNQPPPIICPAVCLEGCLCKSGYCRDSTGVCVENPTTTTTTTTTMQATTQPGCGLNEEFHPPGSCLSGCHSNCALLNQPPPIICPAVCLDGCLCKSGYCRNSSGICAKIPTPVCANNQVYSACVKCIPSCPLGLPSPCEATSDLLPCTPGCTCPPGMVLQDGVCIEASQCPDLRECPVFEDQFTGCEPCEQLCRDLAASSVTVCTEPCASGCRCIAGYCRDNLGRCVPIKTTTAVPITSTTVQPECGLNEEFHPSGSCLSGCHSNCALLNQPPPIICPAVCLDGCLCKPGYCRNSSGVCVENLTPGFGN